ncbi:MAG: methyltransferase domain-containing protein [Chloroflexi bacterium]|nr:methyltransferase domain-containing protein [Chloroflexota bacterium]
MVTAAKISKEERWGTAEVLAYLNNRRIGTNCPPLRSYLYPGARVLDVGCGPGAITLEVAGLVHPGSVTGVDIREEAIAHARRQAEAAQAGNVSFAVGDARHLELPDDSFDLTYTLNTTDYLPDPVMALREYRRVTAPGGWVVTTLADPEKLISYPAYPALTRYRQALSKPPDQALGRRCIALFTEAGFTEIKVELYTPPEFCIYPGAPLFESGYNILRLTMDTEGVNGAAIQERIAAGALTLEEVLQARRDLDAWYRHPHAFYGQTIFLAAGRVS